MSSEIATSNVTRRIANLPLVPVNQFSPYVPRCRIRVRVVSKSGVRSFTNARGEGQLFSMDLMDAEGAYTRATCFGAAVDKFFPLITVKKSYEIHPVVVKSANPRFCRYPFEVTLDSGASITALDEDGAIPPMPFNFKPISELGAIPVNETCDVLGIISAREEAVAVSTRYGQRTKRQVTLADDSGTSIALNLWGEKAELDLTVGTVVFLRNTKLSDYNGRSLDLNEGSFLEANPDDPRAFRVQAWYQNGGKDQILRPMTTSQPRGQKRNLAEALAEDAFLVQDGGDREMRSVNLHHVTATVVSVSNQRAPFYWGCTAEVAGENQKMRCCQKKVENGQCGAGHICNEPKARYILPVQVADAFGSVHCRAFGDEAEKLVDVPAAEVAVLEDERMAGSAQAEKTYDRIFRSMLRRWSMTLRSRKETWEGAPRVQINVERCAPVDLTAEAKQMLSEIYAVL